MVESLNCNSCGAPLDVPSSAKFVRCNHCNTNLEIRRTSAVTFTESVDRLTETTEELADQVEKLTRRSDVEALDRQWDIDRQSFMIPTKNGHSHVPDGDAGMAGTIGGAAFGVLWTIFAVAITQSAPSHGPFGLVKLIFPLFGVVIVCMVIFGGLHNRQRAKGYREAEQAYRRRRDQLMRDDA